MKTLFAEAVHEFEVVEPTIHEHELNGQEWKDEVQEPFGIPSHGL